ncbi:hypothetical protein ABEB36_015620 [Hypothenemus hampei]|uniref:Uncharacterized protein n=1 Tax=Hypothenemus hampei TaxID=57062 RepID=A0ABD1DZ86_HYPHA
MSLTERRVEFLEGMETIKRVPHSPGRLTIVPSTAAGNSYENEKGESTETDTQKELEEEKGKAQSLQDENEALRDKVEFLENKISDLEADRQLNNEDTSSATKSTERYIEKVISKRMENIADLENIINLAWTNANYKKTRLRDTYLNDGSDTI